MMSIVLSQTAYVQ